MKYCKDKLEDFLSVLDDDLEHMEEIMNSLGYDKFRLSNIGMLSGIMKLNCVKDITYLDNNNIANC